MGICALYCLLMQYPDASHLQSVLSGLNPAIVLEICSRYVLCVFGDNGHALVVTAYQFFQCHVFLAISDASRAVCCSRAHMWYMVPAKARHSSFQQTVLRTVNDKSAFLQKELDNAVREGTRGIN